MRAVTYGFFWLVGLVATIVGLVGVLGSGMSGQWWFLFVGLAVIIDTTIFWFTDAPAEGGVIRLNSWQFWVGFAVLLVAVILAIVLS